MDQKKQELTIGDVAEWLKKNEFSMEVGMPDRHLAPSRFRVTLNGLELTSYRDVGSVTERRTRRVEITAYAEEGLEVAVRRAFDRAEGKL